MANSEDHLFAVFETMKQNFILLAAGGLAGAVSKALFWPTKKMGRRIGQAMGGFLAAVFLGGFLAIQTNRIIDGGPWAWIMCAYLIAISGERSIEWIQNKVLGSKI